MLVIRFGIQVSTLSTAALVTRDESFGLSAGRRLAVMVAGLSFGVYTLLFFAAIDRTSIDRAIAFSCLYPTMFVARDWIITRRHPSLLATAGCSLIVAGAISRISLSGHLYVGDALAAVSSLAFFAYLLSAEHALRGVAPISALTLQIFTSAWSWLLVVFVALPIWFAGRLTVTNNALLVGALIGIIAALGHTALSQSQLRFGPVTAAAIASLAPALSAFAGVLVFDRTGIVPALVSAAAVFSGVALVVYDRATVRA